MSEQSGKTASRSQAESRTGLLDMVLASLLFATGGLVLKWTNWNPLAINGIRSLFGSAVIFIFMKCTGRKLQFGKTVWLGAFAYMAMTTLFVASNKMTAAGNAIVLQYTCPLWIVLISWMVLGRKPNRKQILAMLLIGTGILCFFFDSLKAGHLAGDLTALLSGFFYAVLFMLNSLPGGDALSSVLIGQWIAFLCFGGFSLSCSWDLTNVLALIWLGAFQVGFAYLFFSLGTGRIDPLKASLISGIEPVLNPMLVALFGYETLSGLSLLGAVIVIASVLWYSWPAKAASAS